GGGPAYDGRSGPPQRYYTGYPPEQPHEDFDQPPVRGVASDRGPRYDDVGDGRPRPWPSARPPERRPEPTYRRASQPPSDNYRRFWDEGNDRRGRPPVSRPLPGARQAAPAVREAAPLSPREAPPPQREAAPPPQRDVPERSGGPVARVAVGAHQMVISIAEYESLQNQARELQRLLGTRRDFREDRGYRDEHDPRE